MEKKKKPSYKDINGTTKVGDFLRKVGKSKIWDFAVKIAKESNVPVLETLGKLLDKDQELNQTERETALILLDFDLKEQQEITKRWQADMSSDSYLSKNIRPIVLGFSWLLVAIVVLVIKDLSGQLIAMLSSLTMTINVAYFGGREMRHFKILKHKLNASI